MDIYSISSEEVHFTRRSRNILYYKPYKQSPKIVASFNTLFPPNVKIIEPEDDINIWYSTPNSPFTECSQKFLKDFSYIP